MAIRRRLLGVVVAASLAIVSVGTTARADAAPDGSSFAGGRSCGQPFDLKFDSRDAFVNGNPGEGGNGPLGGVVLVYADVIGLGQHYVSPTNVHLMTVPPPPESDGGSDGVADEMGSIPCDAGPDGANHFGPYAMFANANYLSSQNQILQNQLYNYVDPLRQDANELYEELISKFTGEVSFDELCEEIAEVPGSHVAGSSLSDEELECLEYAESSKVLNFFATLQGLLEKYDDVKTAYTILKTLYDLYLSRQNVTPPGPAPVPAPTAAPSGNPQPTPTATPTPAPTVALSANPPYVDRWYPTTTLTATTTATLSGSLRLVIRDVDNNIVARCSSTPCTAPVQPPLGNLYYSPYRAQVEESGAATGPEDSPPGHSCDCA